MENNTEKESSNKHLVMYTLDYGSTDFNTAKAKCFTKTGPNTAVNSLTG